MSLHMPDDPRTSVLLWDGHHDGQANPAAWQEGTGPKRWGEPPADCDSDDKDAA